MVQNSNKLEKFPIGATRMNTHGIMKTQPPRFNVPNQNFRRKITIIEDFESAKSSQGDGYRHNSISTSIEQSLDYDEEILDFNPFN